MAGDSIRAAGEAEARAIDALSYCGALRGSVYDVGGTRGRSPHIPRRRARASSSALRSSSHNLSRVRADTRASPSRTSRALMSSLLSTNR